MPSENSKIQTRPIEDLLGRIRALRQQGQQTITIPAAEADRLADSLSQVMTRLVTIQEEMIDVLSPIPCILCNRQSIHTGISAPSKTIS